MIFSLFEFICVHYYVKNIFSCLHLRAITVSYVSSFALSGIHCRITTVSDVPVKAGESVSIPCLYEAQYRDDVKYLCKGYRWAFCKTVIRTDQEPCSGRFCISDDKEQRIFTVTIKNITDEDSYFWCAVEISGPDTELTLETHTAQPATSTRNGTGSGSPKDERKRSVLYFYFTQATSNFSMPSPRHH
uniref:Immunoglobulin V-set domain-containing protein n=1 Tax=Stegastes partitus TaxID=144197 RepID=A0A3B4ZWG7_9TELE